VKKTENGQGAKMAYPPSAKAWDKGQNDISLQGLKPCRQWASHNSWDWLKGNKNQETSTLDWENPGFF